MFNESFWVAASFVIFIALLYKKVSSIIVAAMDDKISGIKSQLQKATLINQEAQNIRDSYLVKKKENIVKAKQLIKNAEIEAHKLIFKNDEFLKESIKKKLASTELLINEMENRAIKELRMKATLQAVEKFKIHIEKTAQDQLFYSRSIISIKKAI